MLGTVLGLALAMRLGLESHRHGCLPTNGIHRFWDAYVDSYGQLSTGLLFLSLLKKSVKSILTLYCKISLTIR